MTLLMKNTTKMEKKGGKETAGGKKQNEIQKIGLDTHTSRVHTYGHAEVNGPLPKL